MLVAKKREAETGAKAPAPPIVGPTSSAHPILPKPPMGSAISLTPIDDAKAEYYVLRHPDLDGNGYTGLLVLAVDGEGMVTLQVERGLVRVETVARRDALRRRGWHTMHTEPKNGISIRRRS